MREDVDIWEGQGAYRVRLKESWGARMESRVLYAVQVPITATGYTGCSYFLSLGGRILGNISQDPANQGNPGKTL
jgi:hypothetical protein